MKTLNDFLKSESNNHVLTVNELTQVRGGDNPPKKPDDPFKTLPNGKAIGYWK